jgi:hypothetical protein
MSSGTLNLGLNDPRLVAHGSIRVILPALAPTWAIVPHRTIRPAHPRHKKGGGLAATASFICLTLSRSDRLQVHRSLLAATVFLQFERDALAFVQSGKAGAFHGRNVHEGIGCAVITLDGRTAVMTKAFPFK